MNLFKTPKSSLILILLVLLTASAVAYLPLVGKIGYSNDDWYLMYDAHAAGPKIFYDVFRIDRPARAYLQIPLYSLFGENVLPYHLSLYAFRLLGALSLLWVLRMIWPRHHTATFIISLLFLVYPGFLGQTTAIDYQAHLSALFLGIFSIALSIKAVLASELSRRVSLSIASILLGIAYLSLMEYFIGLEIFRLTLMAVLVWRNKQFNWQQNLAAIFRKWLPFLTAPAAFLFWRFLFFQNERRATDVGAQVGQLFGSPFYKGLDWLVALFQDASKVILLAWTVPLNNLAFQLRLRDMLIGLALAVFIALVVAFSVSFLNGAAEEENPETFYNWKRESWLVGLASVIGGLLPIIVSNRQADFGGYSRYTLTSSVGGAIVLVTLLSYLNSVRIRTALFSTLAGIAILTHYANSVNAVSASESIRNFWWQVFWRVPQFKDGTTLAVDYPQAGVAEDYFIWGPASLIYSPEKQTTIPVSVRLSGIVLTQDNVLRIMATRGQANSSGRGYVSVQDFGNVTVIAQSSSEGCVRVIDGNSPELSSADPQNIILIASRSQINNVILDKQASAPPSAIFGSEPQRGWCYFFEKAELARQQADWAKVAQLGDEALSKGYYPGDSIEWMPFLQAYVALGRQDLLRPLASIMNADPFLKRQTCRILSASAQDDLMRIYVQKTFCE